MSKRAIGIDLGSTLSEVAVIEGGKPVVIVNEEGSNTTPSVVGLKNGERKIGNSAKRQMIVNPKETVNLIKRFMGATYAESDEAIKHVQYNVVNRNGQPRVSIEGKEYSPEEISSMIIGKLKKIAEDYIGEEVTDAIITVPAFFSDNARSATKKAGELAGLNVLRVIAEPTAALLSSNIDMNVGGKYMVTDFGGSTLDNSIADISEGVVEIKATNGDVYLGGTDIDKKIADYVVSEFKKENDIDLSSDAQAMSRILEASEKAKIELSSSSISDINLPYITAKDGTPLHLNCQLSKAKFEQLVQPIVDKLISCAKKAVEASGFNKSDLDGILLVGGSCRIPMVQEALTKEFGVKLIKSSNLDLAVAEGAAIQANTLVGGEGAGDILLLDVCPMNYSIETMGGVATTLIEANTTIPCRKSQIFTTAEDNQPAVTIKVLNGMKPMSRDNKIVGEFNLDGIAPARHGIPQIEVTFDIDANSILTVTAKDKATGKEQHITIENKNSLTDEEVERIKKEAEEHAEEDAKAKERADKLNSFESILFQAEKIIEDFKDKPEVMTDDDKKFLEEKIEELKEVKKTDDIDKMEEITKAIQERMYAVSEKAYSQANPQTNPTSNPFGANFGDMFNGANFTQGGKMPEGEEQKPQ
jgi:molecular chaperone DnaK